MIRVLHVYKYFGPKKFGGVEAFIENLVESTKSKCLHIILACGPVKSTTVIRHRGSIVVLVRPQFTAFSMPVALAMIPIFSQSGCGSLSLPISVPRYFIVFCQD
jgi:hypothetical protein